MATPNPHKAGLSPVELAIALEAFKGKDNTLRASKPAKASSAGKYVWRMIVFSCPQAPAHYCMPVCADWDVRDSDIPADYESTIDQAWLDAKTREAMTTETYSSFLTVTTAPFWNEKTDGAAPKSWREYYATKWPRERRQRYIAWLTTIANRVVATVKLTEQAGTMRWARALGAI
jgi:hypothetical protein